MNNIKKVSIGAICATIAFGAIAYSMRPQTNALETAYAQNGNKPKYVFYFIGDGLGSSQRQVADYYAREVLGDQDGLLINNLDYSALNTTHCLDTLVTDSAAAGTALATGQKTNNGYIAVDENGNELQTLVEAAEEAGMATGVASTTRITHATPASFISHNINRDSESEIAADMVDSGVDYLVGGGARYFLPSTYSEGEIGGDSQTIKSKREDDRDLFAEFESMGYIAEYGQSGVEQFESYEPQAGDQYVNLFTASHLPYTLTDENSEDIEVPTLASITQKGIDLLSQNEEGFFFMVEGGRIDHACHPNDAKGSIDDTIAFDDAVATAYEFYEAHPDETLIVVAADHETGGLGMGTNADYFLNLNTLKNCKIAIEDFMYSDQAYQANGDRAAFYQAIAQNYGLSDLNDDEKAELELAMDMVDQGTYSVENSGSMYNEAVEAVAHIVSKRAGIYWTSYAHTATQIPMSAVGVGSANYSGFLDNTQVCMVTAQNMGLSLEN